MTDSTGFPAQEGPDHTETNPAHPQVCIHRAFSLPLPPLAAGEDQTTLVTAYPPLSYVAIVFTGRSNGFVGT